MSEFLPPSPDQIPVDLPPPVSEVQLLGVETSAIFEPQQKILGSVVLSTEVNIDNLDIEDPDRTLTREEIDNLRLQSSATELQTDQSESLNGSTIELFSESMIGDKDPRQVQTKILETTDYFVDKYYAIAKGPNGFGEALGKLERISKQLSEYDLRDPENNKQAQEFIDDAEKLIDHLMDEELFASTELDKSLAQEQPLSDFKESIGGAIEKTYEVDEISSEDNQFMALGQSILGDFRDIIGNSDFAKQNVPIVKAELTRLFTLIREKTPTNNFDFRDVEGALVILREIVGNVEAQKVQNEKMNHKSMQLALNAGNLFKLVQVSREK